ncbi:MAG: CPBP family glutamic-type intramembrane protease [Ginsengibacter sp.]
MKNMIKEFGQFFKFIVNPFLVINPAGKISIVRCLYFAALGIGAGVLLALVGSMPVIVKYFCYKDNTLIDRMLTHGILYALFVGGVIAPIMEELIGRYYLNSVWGNIIYLFINLLIIGQVLYGFELLQIIVYVLLLIVSLFLIGILYEHNILFKKKISFLVTKYFPAFFYVSVLTFALVHVSNFDICHQHSVFVIFLVLPQFFAGLVLSYLRLKWGLKTGILVHSLNNLVAITLGYLFR